ncbi:hypothetical protein SCHPADRAFT_874899 [Schizopora paradoxa]|uniref:Uncharacterized protein n=1 Tax=Schizopora paradoxa TaxID=27342 RepID=A0A0H2RLP8_9AGAM|nr:hypothetical protein SCHPADRAFT_874899 [Schizopora paradoxa]
MSLPTSFISSTIRTRTAASRVGIASSHQPHTSRCVAQRRSFASSSRRRSSESSGPKEHGQNPEGNSSSSQTKSGKAKSPHALFYSDTLPAMIPVALLGSAVYLGLKLLQQQLATEKALDEANARIAVLELRVEQLIQLRDERNSAAETAKLPPVIDQQKSSRWWFAQA